MAHYNARRRGELRRVPRVPEADHRDDPRLLHRRRPGARDLLRPAHLPPTSRSSACRRPSSGSATPIPASSGWSTWSGRRSPRRFSTRRGNSTAAEALRDGPGQSRRAGRTSWRATCKNYADTIAGNAPLTIKAVEVHRRRDREGREQARPRARRRAGGGLLQQQRLHRRPQGLHGEAQAGVHRHLIGTGIGAASAVLRDQIGAHDKRRLGEDAGGVGRIARSDEALRPAGGRRRRVADDRARQAGLPARAVGLRQDHDAAADRRLRRADRRARSGSATAWCRRRSARCRPSGATCR